MLFSYLPLVGGPNKFSLMPVSIGLRPVQSFCLQSLIPISLVTLGAPWAFVTMLFSSVQENMKAPRAESLHHKEHT